MYRLDDIRAKINEMEEHIKNERLTSGDLYYQSLRVDIELTKLKLEYNKEVRNIRIQNEQSSK